MKTQIIAWGNSQGIRIPKDILEDAGFSLNDTLEITASKGAITLTLPFHHRTLEERVSSFEGELSLLEELTWDEPKGSEVWWCRI